jgi:hypothetical protein
MATSDALNISKKADGDCSRTIGVLTKIDLMDKVWLLFGVVHC